MRPRRSNVVSQGAHGHSARARDPGIEVLRGGDSADEECRHAAKRCAPVLPRHRAFEGGKTSEQGPECCTVQQPAPGAAPPLACAIRWACVSERQPGLGLDELARRDPTGRQQPAAGRREPAQDRIDAEHSRRRNRPPASTRRPSHRASRQRCDHVRPAILGGSELRKATEYLPKSQGAQSTMIGRTRCQPRRQDG